MHPRRLTPGVSQSSSSSGDLLLETMESEMPSPASSPNRADDLEMSSWRAPPNRQVAQETRKELPEGGACVTQGSGTKNDGPELSVLQPETMLEAGKRIPSKECRAPAAVSEDQECRRR